MLRQLMLTSRRAGALAFLAALAGVVLTFVNVYQLRAMQAQLLQLLPEGGAASEQVYSLLLQISIIFIIYKIFFKGLVRPKYVVYGKNIDSGYLKHVYTVLDRAGFVR